MEDVTKEEGEECRRGGGGGSGGGGATGAEKGRVDVMDDADA